MLAFQRTWPDQRDANTPIPFPQKVKRLEDYSPTSKEQGRRTFLKTGMCSFKNKSEEEQNFVVTKTSCCPALPTAQTRGPVAKAKKSR